MYNNNLFYLHSDIYQQKESNDSFNNNRLESPEKSIKLENILKSHSFHEGMAVQYLINKNSEKNNKKNQL